MHRYLTVDVPCHIRVGCKDTSMRCNVFLSSLLPVRQWLHSVLLGGLGLRKLCHKGISDQKRVVSPTSCQLGLAICSQKIRIALTVGGTPLQKGHSLQQQPGALGADAGLKMMVEPGYTACPTATWSLPSKGHAIACNF